MGSVRELLDGGVVCSEHSATHLRRRVTERDKRGNAERLPNRRSPPITFGEIIFTWPASSSKAI